MILREREARMEIGTGLAPVRRRPLRLEIRDNASANAALERARAAFRGGDHLEAIDLYEELVSAAPDQAIDLLAELYDAYKQLGPRDRYTLYVSREFDFGIQPVDRVLDIGSGHLPVPFATHLADVAPDDDGFGRAGAPLERDGRPFFECDVEHMPYEDKDFDFVYCSHVLEHVRDPERACAELMRVGRRGYIETPTRGKDLWLNSALASGHLWAVENYRGRLVFTEYDERDREGIGCDLLMNMHCAPQTKREKAFSALVWLKSSVVNTTLYWEDRFDVEVRRL